MDRRRAAAALLALAACIACSAAAPTATNHTALDLHDGSVEGCYYNFQHYGDGDRIMTNEPCLNCTCHNRMLMCYLRVCPFTKAIGQDCTVEKRADQCCPIVTCPDVPVDLLTSTSTSSPAEYGATGLGKLDKYGCSIHGKYFPEGSKVPPTPNKPCEHCYCIRNMTTCVMQECTLHVDGCTPIYRKDVCCPVRYSCDHTEDEIPLLDDMTTTVRPTPGFLLTTTTISPVTQMSQDCVHDDKIFPDGALIKTEKACEHCYCMKGDIVCVVQECGTPMENEGKNCTSLPPRHGQCCPDTYICEGDEQIITDSTTEVAELTSSPPRRVGVEGSGYRNEPDEPYTETNAITTEIEGSGEEFATVTHIDAEDSVTPENETSEIIDNTLLTTTESSLILGQSTEPDKGQNTIPDSVIEKEITQEPIQDKVTLPSFGESAQTVFEQYTPAIDLTSRKDEISTTDSIFRVDDESIPSETSTTTDHQKAIADSTDLTSKTTFEDEYIPHTSPTTFIETTTPTTEYTNKVPEPSKQGEISTEIYEQTSVTEKNKKTDVFQTPPETETFIESTTIPVTNFVVTESTSVDPNINEVDDNVSPIYPPSRIPGEGDCLLNSITYTNNTSVPSTNNCHTGCKCISSIIKCDPIICSPPPEYMENMNDCQPIYDTPNSCCPTYVCSVKETIPPESHSHMSGTESPKPITTSECSGNDCTGIDKIPPKKPTVCTSVNCLSEIPGIQKEKETIPEKELDSTKSPAIQEECESNDCKDQVQTSPTKPSQDCSDGECQLLPVVPCEGENCKTETQKDIIPEKDLESTKPPVIQEECESNDCEGQVQISQTIPTQDCSDGKCQVLPVVPCEGENCKTETPNETIPEKDLESITAPTLDGHGITCDGENCKTEASKEAMPEKDLESTKAPTIQEKCKSNDCEGQGQTSQTIPSQDCSDGKCQILPVVPCEGENCKSETPKETITEKDLESTIAPILQQECESNNCEGQIQISLPKPSQDCSDGKCQVLPVVPCEAENCKTETPGESDHKKDYESSVHDVPSQICNGEVGCDENHNIGQDECVGESCRRKDFTEVDEKLPSKCSGPDCKISDEATLQSTEPTTEVVTKGSTESDINSQKTETIELLITTTKEKLTETDLDVTKEPIFVVSPEKLSTTSEQIVTEPPKQYDTEKDFLQTDTPMIQTATETSDEAITETLQTEYPKLPVAVTIASQDTYSYTDDRLTAGIGLSQTKPPEYLEIDTEESFTGENDNVSTIKPYIHTDVHATVLAEQFTTLPEIAVTESDKALTEAPKVTATEKDEIKTQSPEIIKKEEVESNPPDILDTEKDIKHFETTKMPFTVTEVSQTTLPEVMITEKETTQSEAPAVDNDNELIETKVPVALPEKEVLHTEVTETFTLKEDDQTVAPEIFITEKVPIETGTLKVTAVDNETVQTEIPEVDVKETSLTESLEAHSTEKQTIPTESPEIAIPTKATIETEGKEPMVTDTIQSKAPDATVTEKGDAHLGTIEFTTEKQVFEVSTPDQHEIKLESTTVHEFDQTSVEDQTVISLSPETDEGESAYVTTEYIPKQQTTTTEKPEIIGNENEDDKSHEPEPINPEELPIEVNKITTEPIVTYTPSSSYTSDDIVTERVNIDVSKTETVQDDAVTESNNMPTLSQETDEIITEQSDRLITEKPEIFTKSPQEIEIKTEKEVSTDKDLHYTSSPDVHDDVSQAVDQTVTESQVIHTKEPEIIDSQYPETSTTHDAIVTDKYKDSSIANTESTHEITDELEKQTEAPESYSSISQAQDKTTKLSELYTILPEDISTTEKSADKPHVTPTSDSDEYEKDIPDKVHYTTLENIEEIKTTDSSLFITEKPDTSATEAHQKTSSDQELVSGSPHLTTKIENKEPESSTDSLDPVTEISKGHSDVPVFIEETEPYLTTKRPDQDIATETYKETLSDIITTQSTYKDELPTEHHTISQGSSYTKVVTDSYVETSTKTIGEDEKEIQEKLTTTIYQTTQSSDGNELDSTISVTETPNIQIVTQNETGEEGSKPFVSDEKSSDTTEDSSLQEPHSPEHTAMDSFTTQTSSQIALDISTEKTPTLNVEDNDIKVQEFGEISTKLPEFIATFELSTLGTKDSATTEPQIDYTSSVDKLSTTIFNNIETQKEQEDNVENDGIFTTSSSLQTEDSKEITKIPMSLVTHIDHATSSQTTLSDKTEKTEQVFITTVEQQLDDEKTKTTLPEVYVTKLQKPSTETPDHKITQQELETESSSKLSVEDLGTDLVDKTTTAIPNQPSDLSTDGPAIETASNEYMQNTEGTPTLDTEEAINNTQPQKTTTATLTLKEKEHDLSNETESVDELITKSPYESQTIQQDITTKTPLIFLDDEHVKETMSTTSPLTEQHGTEYPEVNVHDTHTTLSENETSETEEIAGTEIPKVSTEKEPEIGTSVYVPAVSENTESPIPVVTDTTERDHIPTEALLQLEDETTTYVNLDVVTENANVYTQSKPLSDTTDGQYTVTQQKISHTDTSGKATKVPDQFISSTESLITESSDHDDHHEITVSTDNEKTAEDILSSHSTAMIPEISTMITEIQTEPTGVEKVTFIEGMPSLEETPKPIVMVKETTTLPEIYSTQTTIEKETSTDATVGMTIEPVKKDKHTPTEFTPTTLSSRTEGPSTTTRKEFDESEEVKLTTEPEHEFSETTPFLVELKEHTHQVIDESTRTSTEEIFTTSHYEPHNTERGDQNLDITDKYDDENQTLSPNKVTEYEHKDKLFTQNQDQTEQKVPTTTLIVTDFTERLNDTELVPTTSSTYSETDLHEQDKQYTTIMVQDVVLTTSAAPQTGSEKDLYTTISSDFQNITYPAPGILDISTEKDVNLGTEQPLKSEASVGTTSLAEELSTETSKSTTSKIIEETTTLSPLTDKSTQTEEKPIKMTPSPPTQELTKPVFDDEITEGIPSPDFPPSGTGGYGQEPDYIEEDQAFGPGTCRYGGKVYVSAQQIPRDDPCDFCFCFRSDIICLQQSCPPPIHGCHEEPIQGFCCPRYECPVSMATTLNVTTTTTTTTTTLPPHFLPHAYKGAAQRRGCQIKGHTYKVGEVVRASSGPCLHCTCGGDGQMKCDPKACTPEPMLRQMIAAAVSAKR